MNIGLVSGHAGTIPTVRAVQLYNAIPKIELSRWRIFYFNEDGAVIEYTRRNFRNEFPIDQATHSLIFCHGAYNSTRGNRSVALSIWDYDENTAKFDTNCYINWITNTGISVQTIIVSACYAGNIGNGGNTLIPIQKLVNIRNGMEADGPNHPLLALNGVNVNWNKSKPQTGWTRFTNT